MNFTKNAEGKLLKKSSRSYVFDTGALYLYFTGDKNLKPIFKDIEGGLSDGITSELNSAELYYKTCENLGRDAALIRYRSLLQSSVIVIAPDDDLSLNAGQLKCAHRNKLSIVDAYVISLAKRVRGILYTTDARICDLKIVQTKLLEIDEAA